MGLDETLKEYFQKGKKPDDAVGDELVKDLKKLNFIAEGAEAIYKEAFLGEYQRYYEAERSKDQGYRNKWQKLILRQISMSDVTAQISMKANMQPG